MKPFSPLPKKKRLRLPHASKTMGIAAEGREQNNTGGGFFASVSHGSKKENGI
jgi:hypothetical protein